MTSTIVSARPFTRFAAALCLVLPLTLSANTPTQVGSADLDNLPRSGLAPGAFPYLGIPDGYTATPLHLRELDFGRVALWTGERFHVVEGRVHAAGIRVDRASGKRFSAAEVTGNLEHVLHEAGAVRVFSGTTPRESANDPAAAAIMSAYHAESVCRGNSPIRTYVLRRDDGLTWVRLCEAPTFAGLIVVDAEPLRVNAQLLPAKQIRQQLDNAGRIALPLHFATDSAEILPESQPQIAQILAMLTDDPALELAIHGHTDSTGDTGHNQRLSESRAAAVVAALTGHGIDGKRLRSAGFGADQPVADNDTEDGRARNRRVELVKQ